MVADNRDADVNNLDPRHTLAALNNRGGPGRTFATREQAEEYAGRYPVSWITQVRGGNRREGYWLKAWLVSLPPPGWVDKGKSNGHV